ncbi:MAG: DUF3667 domain-containing protein, partial [Colwelliaceae bacterium]|nr:DUF3667 domain-containing protein [Colwelliaceae bacterium]
RTLFPLIFKPGFLTNEYIAGRRVHYVPPLRLYLFISIIFFISLKFIAVEDGSEVLSINNSKSNVTELTKHIQQLEHQKINASVEITPQLEKKITNFKAMKQDITDSSNLYLKGMTSELIKMELEKLDNESEFSEKQQLQLDELRTKITKVKNGEDVDLSSEGFSIGNNEDGSLSFDFLSDENNKKLTEFSELLSKKAEKAFKGDPSNLIREAIEKLPQLMFILLPLFAALLKCMFIFSNRLYLEHLTVALHSHSFIFISILLIEVIEYIQLYFLAFPSISEFIELLEGLIVIWIPVYLFIMHKRVYRQGKLLTSIKYMIIGLSYMLMITLTGTIAFIWGLAST